MVKDMLHQHSERMDHQTSISGLAEGLVLEVSVFVYKGLGHLGFRAQGLNYYHYFFWGGGHFELGESYVMSRI